jgi:NAD-dependent deacetylase
MAKTDGRSELAEMIDAARSIVAFTGAGVSTECGIPDFRSRDSAWKRHPPMPFDEFLASEANQVVAWRNKFAMDDLYGASRPGRGHRALASLMARGKVRAIITQNIDGLHQAAGAPADRVVELHGSGRYATCLGCGVRHELDRIRPAFETTGRAPRCLCGGVVKSATISFGQQMPAEAMRRAQRETLACDLFLAIGSTLVVHPAAGFPLLAKENGARLVIVNRDPTPLDAIADLTLRDDIGSIFEPFIADSL